MVLHIDPNGRVLNPRVTLRLNPHIERGAMAHVRGIIVHQTGGSSVRSTVASYAKAGENGAHFLIDRDGTIYQTASVFKRTNHVGKLRARCLAEHRCEPVETTRLSRMKPSPRNRHEMRKEVPDRFPSNRDSIGIELVGQALPLNEPNADRRTYETVSADQNRSLAWLIQELRATLGMPTTEVFRHPDVSQKNATEAASARW